MCVSCVTERKRSEKRAEKLFEEIMLTFLKFVEKQQIAQKVQ